MRAVGAARYRRVAVEGGTPRARMTLDEEISYHLGPLGLYEAHEALDSEALGPPAIQEAGSVGELKFAGSQAPSWCERAFAGLSPAEYSKFLVISTLAHPEALTSMTRS
jgi:hypothetical protein